ncbi:trypsin-like peptidase domain-containing protein [Blastococcus sp. BMG 814]|uniref:Trypsin-like peptidase domain-containing protein n=1 Tax=Blastococcus carthaginiensis TaxID=3050034 RepID=A0ABT9I7Q7_9ACTN|nr:trypsin-like peptidase domain-containing protein [Blastococcus carthaginiensis]
MSGNGSRLPTARNVAEIWVPADRSAGSGYLLSNRLVLTARHVVQAAMPTTTRSAPAKLGHDELTALRHEVAHQLRCRVRRLSAGPGQSFADATVVWWHPARDIDAALLLVLDPSWDNAPAEPVAWAEILDGSAPVACTAVGFPATDVQVDADGELRESRQLIGVVPPLSQYKRQRWAVHVEGRVGTVMRAGSSWSGMSGAALFAHHKGLLLGIVEADVDADDPERRELRAQPVHTFADHPDLVDWLVADGGVWTRTRLVDDASTPRSTRIVGDRISGGVGCWRDRDAQRAELRALVLSRQRVISVTGRRGIGKSAMVARVLADFEEPDPRRSPLEDVDGLVYLSTRTGPGSLTLSGLYEALAGLLPPEERSRLSENLKNVRERALPALWQALSARRAVVVLDNLDDLQDPGTGELLDAEVVAFLDSACRAPAGQTVVTTSQRPLRLPGDLVSHVRELELDAGLPEEDAVHVLRAIAPGGQGLRELSDEQLRQAARTLHGIPRGLELLARLLTDDPFAAQDVLESDVPPEELVRQLVSQGWTRLDAIGRAVVGLLAAAGIPLPAEAVPPVLADVANAREVRSVLATLWRSRELAYDRDSGLVRLHPLDADHVRAVLLSGETLRQRDTELARWYASQRRPVIALRFVSDAMPHVKEYEHRWRAGDHGAALTALAEVADFLARGGEGALLRTALRQAEQHPDVPVSPVLWCRAALEFFDGSLHEAEEALRTLVAHSSGDEALPLPKAAIDVRYGTTLRHLGRAHEAVRVLTTVGEDDAAPHNCRMDALFEQALSLCYLQDVPAAAMTVRRMVELSRDDDPPLLRAQRADVEALVALLEQDTARALRAVEEGLDAYRDSPESDSAGFLRNVRALVLLAQGDPEGAEQTLRRAAQEAEKLQNLRLTGLCRMNLAWSLLYQGRIAEAVSAAACASGALVRNGALEAPAAQALVEVLARRGSDVPLEAALDRLGELSASSPDLHQPGTLARVALGSGAGGMRDR